MSEKMDDTTKTTRAALIVVGIILAVIIWSHATTPSTPTIDSDLPQNCTYTGVGGWDC